MAGEGYAGASSGRAGLYPVSRGPARAIGPGQRVPAQVRCLALGAGVGAEAVAVRGRAASLLAVAGDRDLPFRSRATGIPALLIAFAPRSSSRRRRGRRRPSVPPARVYIRRRIVVCVCVCSGCWIGDGKVVVGLEIQQRALRGRENGVFFLLKVERLWLPSLGSWVSLSFRVLGVL